METPQTWHYGLVADWWAEFNTDGPEIDWFGNLLLPGRPVLDAGCGTGRLLVPWLKNGHDVDGCDASADMIARCRARASAEGFEPRLWAQPLHALDPPRRYGTVVLCGVIGLGSTRAQDQEALGRVREALDPDGLLLLDNEVPYCGPMRWARWQASARGTFPEPWPEHGDRRRLADGSEIELRARALALDPLDQTVVLEMRAEHWREGELVAVEEHTLSMRGYLRDELLLMLEKAGFSDVTVTADYTGTPPDVDSRFLVYEARP